MQHAAAISTYLQPFLLAIMCGITGFSAWQLKKWMERIEQDHKIFYSRINSLDQFAATALDDRQRKNAAMDRVFSHLDDCATRLHQLETNAARRDERLAVMEKRLDYLERD